MRTSVLTTNQFYSGRFSGYNYDMVNSFFSGHCYCFHKRYSNPKSFVNFLLSPLGKGRGKKFTTSARIAIDRLRLRPQ